MQDLTGLDTNSTNLTPGIDMGLINTIVIAGTILSAILTVVVVVYLVINIMRRWKSEKAMVDMAKDVQAIKLLLEKQLSSSAPSQTPASPPSEQPPKPANEP